MRRLEGFTFIETLVVMVMMGIMLTSGYVYFSGFSSRQELDKSRSKLIDQIKIARSYARANILPENQVSDLKYVKLEINGSGEAVISSDIGNNYSSVPVVGADMELSNPLTGCGLCFLAGDGKLVNDDAGSVSSKGVDENVAVSIVSKKDGTIFRSILVNSNGSVEKTESLVVPTEIPSPTPLPADACENMPGEGVCVLNQSACSAIPGIPDPPGYVCYGGLPTCCFVFSFF